MDILQQFIQNGYVEIDLSELSIHDAVYDKLDNFEIKWADGDLLENLPEYSEVISNSKVTSVLKTVLGDKYIEHPHVAMFDGRYTPNKVNHRDWPTHFTQEVRTRKPYYFNHWNRHHHCRYVQVFYCPYAENATKSGTGFYVGSQYYDDDFDAHLDAVPFRMRSSGKVVIAHGDTFHRSYYEGKTRWIIKCLFLRVKEPNVYSLPDTELWNDIIHPEDVLNYHWNWYHGQNYNFKDISYDDAKILEKNTTNRDRTESIYRKAGIIDIDSMLSDEHLLDPNMQIAVSLNYNISNEVLINKINSNVIWNVKASLIDILANRGVGSSDLVGQWIEWMKIETSGYCIRNLLYGAPIVCMGNDDALNAVVKKVKDPGFVRGNIILVEALTSLLKLSKSCKVVPDVWERLTELQMNSNYIIQLFAKHTEKKLKE